MKNRLIVGLGNPGKQYDKTRHNVGFMVINDLASDANANFKYHKKSDSEIAEIDDLILAKPQTFMNNSGNAVSKLISYFNVAMDDVLIIYDDVDIELGKVRYKTEGSSAGHKGMQSIIDNLGTNEIKRIRIGVGNSGEEDTSDYVLAKFSTAEIEKMKSIDTDIQEILKDKFTSENGA